MEDIEKKKLEELQQIKLNNAIKLIQIEYLEKKEIGFGRKKGKGKKKK